MNPIFPAAGLIDPVLEAPAGTRCLFHQATPPVGWVTDATITDHALRIVTGAGGGTGGSINSSSWIGGGTFNANAFTISLAQMPSHTHTVNSNHVHSLSGGANFWYFGSGSQGLGTSGVVIANLHPSTGSATTGLASPTATAGSGSSVTMTYTTPNVKYAAMVVAQKS